jgi:DNA-binding transcriptional LysR family regulator
MLVSSSSIVVRRYSYVQYLICPERYLGDMDEGIELRHLRYFAAVAEELHFGRAAKRLYIAQPPLSQQIRRLEEMVGHPLLIRTSRAVKLTEAGAALLERAKRTLNRVSEDLAFARSVGRGESGSLRVGFIASAMQTKLPATLNAYRRLYPDVELRLQETYTSNLIESIRDGSSDVGFLRDGGPVESLKVDLLLEEKYIVILPFHHRLARHSSIRIAQLKEEPFVFFPKSAGPTAWDRTMNLCKEQGFQARIVQEAPHWVTIASLVGAGLGVTIAPACIRHATNKTVACRPLVGPGRTLIELARRTDETSPVTAAFCQLAQTLFRKRN